MPHVVRSHYRYMWLDDYTAYCTLTYTTFRSCNFTYVDLNRAYAYSSNNMTPQAGTLADEQTFVSLYDSEGIVNNG
jgi:hypothetical protein